jgi:rubrerythrin
MTDPRTPERYEELAQRYERHAERTRDRHYTEIAAALRELAEMKRDPSIRFAERMRDELRENAGKGDFEAWSPSGADLFREIQHHLTKLFDAIADGNGQDVREYACDIANYCRKAHELYAAEKSGAKP